MKQTWKVNVDHKLERMYLLIKLPAGCSRIYSRNIKVPCVTKNPKYNFRTKSKKST